MRVKRKKRCRAQVFRARNEELPVTAAVNGANLLEKQERSATTDSKLSATKFPKAQSTTAINQVRCSQTRLDWRPSILQLSFHLKFIPQDGRI